MSVALEAAFPRAAIIKVWDGLKNWNRKWLASMLDGTLYAGIEDYGEWGGMFRAGSRLEGLAIEGAWGHPTADVDRMRLFGGPLGVHVSKDCQPTGRTGLIFRPENCPPTYCKLEVRDPHALLGLEVCGERLDESCIYRTHKVNWLHTNNTLRRIQSGDTIHGPAGQKGMYEHVPTFVCSASHPDFDRKYVDRARHGWPSPQQLEVIKQLPMLLVLVGHKYSSDFPFQARFSWSHMEVMLISELPQRIKQVYMAIKYVFKFIMNKSRGPNADDGRSYVGSYHLKTVFLYHLEKNTPAKIASQLEFFLALLYDLRNHLDTGKLPHYFLPDCNLLETVVHQERRFACDVINHILSDPLSAILTCPTCPQDIYGNVQPDDLVAAFHQVSSQPMCAESRQKLIGLLGLLDERRRVRYQEQRDRDDSVGVSDRLGLAGLVDILEHRRQSRSTCCKECSYTTK